VKQTEGFISLVHKKRANKINEGTGLWRRNTNIHIDYQNNFAEQEYPPDDLQTHPFIYSHNNREKIQREFQKTMEKTSTLLTKKGHPNGVPFCMLLFCF
jgi:hypothetical protein